MKVKHYTASNMQEAVMKVKNDLGRDAIILHTRRLRKGGLWGWFGEDMVEVTAACDPSTASHTADAKSALQTRERPALAAPVSSVPLPPAVNAGIEQTQLMALQQEMAQMRKLIQEMVAKAPEMHGPFADLYRLLLKNDVEDIVAKKLIQGLQERFSGTLPDPAVCRTHLRNQIRDCISRVEGIKLTTHNPKVVAFVGPTGVGKTTTIAKLAANFSLVEGKKVALITADTYRIAAVEQIKTYGEIIGIPVEVVFNADEMQLAIARNADKNIILIDTAGRSPNNTLQMQELTNLFSVHRDIEIHLVLSATTKYRDILDAIDKFGGVKPQKLLFTKVDESNTFGAILNLMYLLPVSLSYVTNGQAVPDDLEVANPAKIASMILKE